jgi:hypothetical protein
MGPVCTDIGRLAAATGNRLGCPWQPAALAACRPSLRSASRRATRRQTPLQSRLGRRRDALPPHPPQPGGPDSARQPRLVRAATPPSWRPRATRTAPARIAGQTVTSAERTPVCVGLPAPLWFDTVCARSLRFRPRPSYGMSGEVSAPTVATSMSSAKAYRSEPSRALDGLRLAALLASLRCLFRKTHSVRLPTFASLRSAHRRRGPVDRPRPFDPHPARSRPGAIIPRWCVSMCTLRLLHNRQLAERVRWVPRVTRSCTGKLERSGGVCIAPDGRGAQSRPA